MGNDTKETRSPIRWYYKPVVVIMAILCVGPFALPLVWLTPAFKKTHKIVISLLVIILSAWLVNASVKLYNTVSEQLRELQYILRP